MKPASNPGRFSRGLFGVPALAGRAEPLSVGERGTAWGFAFHVIPAYQHTIEVIRQHLLPQGPAYTS